LAEAVITIGITGLIMATLASILAFSGHNFEAFTNYVDLDGGNRIAMDTLTRDLRECNRVTACTSTLLAVEDSDGSAISYSYSSTTQTLTRTKNGVSKTLLHGCDMLSFSIAQRNPVGGSYDVYPAPSPATAKVVNVSWNCSRTIFGRRMNTESAQTARVVIRKQG
jgi:hypothetical protein